MCLIRFFLNVICLVKLLQRTFLSIAYEVDASMTWT